MRVSFVLIGFSAALAATAAHAQGAAPSVDLQGNGVDLAVRLNAAEPDKPVISSQADLKTELSNLETRLQVDLKTGAADQNTPGAGWWNSGGANLGATWTPSSLAKVEIGARNSLRVEYSATDPVFADSAQRYVESRQAGADAAAIFTPLPPVSVKVGAAVSTDATQTAAIDGTGALTTDLLETRAQQVFTQVQWKPLPVLSFDGGGKIESTGVLWSGAQAGSFASLDPSVGATVNPWRGAAWRLSIDRAATPLSADQFLGYGAGLTPGLALQPDREWRYKASLQQKAGPIDLDASVLQAKVQSYAYLAPTPAVAARVGVGAGDRSEVDAGLSAPLPVFGLAPFTVKASGAWRMSSVADPVSGVVGRVSGESPYDAKLTLSQAFGGGMSWGVSASATGPARTFAVSQITSFGPTAGIGGFLRYHGPVTLQVTLDNILGGDREQRDTYYTGPRDLNVIDRTDDARTAARAIHISLIRPL